jgi:hypothetical protein
MGLDDSRTALFYMADGIPTLFYAISLIGTKAEVNGGHVSYYSTNLAGRSILF